MTQNNEEAAKELNQIPIDKTKHKIRFLINGMRNTEIILREFITELRAEMKKLEILIPGEECIEFYKECFGFKKTEPNIIQKAEQVIKDFSGKEENPGKDN
ncbi:hypothetical protein ES702_07113 [subsurface metagenome]